jgi:hypothetical protein
MMTDENGGRCLSGGTERRGEVGQENKANKTEERVQTEVEELSKRNSRNQKLKLESITVR